MLDNVSNMKISTIVRVLSGLCLLAMCQAAPSPESVKALGQRVADWQIRTFDDHGKYRALNGKNWSTNRNYHDCEWHMGALYVGMDQWRHIADSPKKYTEWLKMIGERNGWQLHHRRYNADDHTVGQFYLSLYQEFKDPAMMRPTRERFDWILANPRTGSLEWTGYGKDKDKTDCHHRWGWCDALFMAPPVWARLAKVTGDQKYLDFMHQEYLASYDLLWNPKDRFFWRDSSYFKKREKNGTNVYWSRGNGWVFGGLALMLPDLPLSWEHREFYQNLFQEMAFSIKDCQRDDGTWSMGLLGGTLGYPNKEASGTAFFTFGLAWGINQGLLDRATYEPVVLKAWAALEQCVTPEGMLGYVQPVGAAPGDSFPNKTEVYGIGAFLSASSEVYKMLK